MPAKKYKVNLSEGKSFTCKLCYEKARALHASKHGYIFFFESSGRCAGQRYHTGFGCFGIDGGKNPATVRGRRPGSCLVRSAAPGSMPEIDRQTGGPPDCDSLQ